MEEYDWDVIVKAKEGKALKRMTLKYADACSGTVYHVMKDGDVVKAVGSSDEMDQDEMNARLVINTTNIIDSHLDLHIPGLWNKTVKDRKGTLHLQEHKLEFDKIISDEVVPSVKMISWADLGQPYQGKTQALLFDSRIEKRRNGYMFTQYWNGWVKNHSVCMQYVSLFMCVNSTEKYWAEEKANWDKYISMAVNPEVAISSGYFWAVTEAKMIEGSAVPIGSNQATPTISVKGSFTDTHSEEDKTDSRKSTIDPIELKNLLNQNLQQLWTKN